MTVEQLREAIASGDERTVARLLPDTVFWVLGRNDLAEPHAAVALDGDRRAILLFTDRDAADAFGPTLRLLPVAGSNIPPLAKQYSADQVRLDPAGPHPVSFDVPRWQMLLDGIAVADGATWLPGLTVAAWTDLPDTVRSALAAVTTPARLLAFLRVAGARSIPTIGIDERPPSPDTAERLSRALSGIGGFEYLDVMELDPALADRIVAAIPESQVTGS